MTEHDKDLARRALAPIVENPVDAPAWTDLGTVTATPAVPTRSGWWIAPAAAIAVLLIGSVGFLSAKALRTDPTSPDPSTSPSVASWDEDRIEGSRSDWNTGLALTVEPEVWLGRVEGLCGVPLTIAGVRAYADESVASDVSHGRVLTTIDTADEARLGLYATQILWELALDVCVEEPLNEAQSWSMTTWVNQTGFWESPAWPARFSLLCAVDDAGDDPYRALAAQFIAEDVATDLGFASPGWVPDEDQATIALELMVRSPAPFAVCSTTGLPLFDATDAVHRVGAMWTAIAERDDAQLAEILHPDASIDTIGLRQLRDGVGGDLSSSVETSTESFGSEDQPQVCWGFRGTLGTAQGSVVFRLDGDVWKPWEVRPNDDRCDATPVTTTIVPRVDSIGSQPSITSTVISPSWVTVDNEDPGEIIDTVLRGGDLPELSESIVQIVIENLQDDGWTPYLYQRELANDLTISEDVSVRLGNNDSLGVKWRFRWSDTPDCDVCTTSQAEWPNGWMVWTRTDESRGLIIFAASHPNLPLEAEIAIFADPTEWPEGRSEDQPILRTTQEAAESLAASILNSMVNVIPIPTETQ